MQNHSIPALRVSGLELRYGANSAPVLSLPELSVAPGETIGISGPSGSGKSSLLYLLSGLLRPTSGKVVWGNDDITGFGETACDRWRHKMLGFIFQDFHLIGELDPLGNVLLPASFSQWRVQSALRKRAIDLLDQVGVPTARKSTADLSRGEQQRVAIARALLFDPPVLLADEPTASLDEYASGTVADLLFSLAGTGRSMIVVSHDRDVIARCPRVLRLDKGHAATTSPSAAPLSPSPAIAANTATPARPEDA